MNCTADYVLVQSGDDYWEYAPTYAESPRRKRKESTAERYLLLCAAALAMSSLSLFATVAFYAPAHHRAH
ncbi:hypothetical protein PsYK624_164380 [Phanerochaete sordida]|uniref:Uncharacterized protein n=1 Tax=Phanerochaete sordida TaxID=48140 RepID=A0A9P3GQU3_9APHY|nr:hypothetical protein PsYK624_164380 [Phanerochaete sordida]